MSNHESLLEFWNFMQFSEKQQLMQQFRKVHGNHYTKAEFLAFVANHHKGLKATSRPSDSKMTDRQWKK